MYKFGFDEQKFCYKTAFFEFQSNFARNETISLLNLKKNDIFNEKNIRNLLKHNFKKKNELNIFINKNTIKMLKT